MTPRETLEKYGLKTDVKSIRERMEKDTYWALARSLSINNPMQFSKTSIEKIFDDIRAADLTLLCELAEKGERYEKSINALKTELNNREPSFANGVALGVIYRI